MLRYIDQINLLIDHIKHDMGNDELVLEKEYLMVITKLQEAQHYLRNVRRAGGKQQYY